MDLDDLTAQVRDGRPEGTPLDHLADAAVLAQHLDDLADHLLGHFVDRARQAGASWTMIGQRFGVSKQAAQKRFVAGDVAMDRFTNRAAVVVLKAQNAARDRGHREVTSLHLVLGLVAEWDAFAGRAIQATAVSRDLLVDAVEAALPAATTPLAQQAPFSGGLKKVLELSVREALRLGHDYVGTEHILLGLLEARDEPGALVLAGLGITKPAIEEWTLRALQEYRDGRASDVSHSGHGTSA